tara:strand:+ start:86 stop:256 length:171 start_codon:yes stop_codon:yes gene_type:complete
MEYAEILKLYGPMGIGWIIAAYLGQFILKRYDADIDAKTKLALALQSLAESVKASK